MTLAARRKAGKTTTTEPRQLRVAIYTRKSHAAGLEQEFSSIDAQRQAVESFVASQKGAGWTAMPDRYDDGGFSGATMDRPAFQRLLADIEAGKVDIVGVYRIDRLSRNARDYVNILQLFEERGVQFVSVSEQFNTTTPAGRLVFNQFILLAQFERELISERIRDKMQATRRRGAWTGGRPILGYDVVDKKLVVNADEAPQVREMFQLYLQHGCLRVTVAELQRRGWRNKQWTTRGGSVAGGTPFTTATLHVTLTNVVYAGQMRAGTEVVPGAHEAIVETKLWDAVQQQLAANNVNGGARARNKTNALLRGLLRCGRCGSAMIHSFTTREQRRYRYYLCMKAHRAGADTCPNARVAAGEFEQFVVNQIRVMGTDEALLLKTAEAARAHAAERRDQLAAERRRLDRRLRDAEEGERERLERRLDEVRAEADALGSGAVDVRRLRVALAGFQPIWDHLFPAERERILRLLIERITYDPETGDVDLELRPVGVDALANEAEETR